MLCSSNSSSLIKIARLKILLKMYCCRKLRIMVYYTQFLNLQAKRFFPYQAEEKHSTRRLFIYCHTSHTHN